MRFGIGEVIWLGFVVVVVVGLLVLSAGVVVVFVLGVCALALECDLYSSVSAGCCGVWLRSVFALSDQSSESLDYPVVT